MMCSASSVGRFGLEVGSGQRSGQGQELDDEGETWCGLTCVLRTEDTVGDAPGLPHASAAHFLTSETRQRRAALHTQTHTHTHTHTRFICYLPLLHNKGMADESEGF